MGKQDRRKARRSTKHHIVPESRGGTSELENIANVRGTDHEHYHTLFANKRPEEIVGYLVHTFWKDDWNYVHRAVLQYGPRYGERHA